MKTFIAFAVVLSLALAPAAQAEEASVLSLGIKGGVGLPQISTPMDATFYAHLEIAYMFPVWGSRLGLFTAVGYSQPTASGDGTDPSLPGGAYTWEMTQRQTTWDLGVLLKFMPRTSGWNVGILAGSRLMFLSTLTNGEAGGEPFGEHDERANVPGLIAGLQAEVSLGPGALFAELSLAAAFEELRTTGETTVAELGLLAGYRLTFAF